MVRWYIDILYETFCAIVFPDREDNDTVWVFPKSFFSALLATFSIAIVFGFESFLVNRQTLSQIPFPPQTALQLILSILLLVITFSASLFITGVIAFVVRLFFILYLRNHGNRHKPSEDIRPQEKEL